MGEDEIFSNQDSDSSDALGLFDSSVSSVGSDAFQDSTISTNELSGLLGIGLGFTGDNSANSLLSTTFQVDTSGVYALAGLFSGAEDVMNITLSSISGTLLDLDGSGLGPFYQEFSLSAGETYTLEASLAGSDFSGFGRGASIDFTFGVPEPTTAVLIGLGLLLTGMRRRR